MTIQKIELQKIEVILFWELYFGAHRDGKRWYSISLPPYPSAWYDNYGAVSYCP